MNKQFLIILSCLSFLFASCAQQSDIANLQSQIDELKSGRIASIESQVSSITASISALHEADREIKGYITALQNTASELQKSINTANGKIDDLQKALTLVNSAIETLQAKDSALEKRIDDLKEYVDTQLKNAKDWVSATFATLEQYNGIVSEIGGLRGSISAINTAMAQMESRLDGKITSMKGEIEAAYTKAMGTLETSLKNWVNEQLKGYLTIAETEAKLAALKGSLAKEDESLREDIDKLSTSLDSAKTELTEGYKAAIKKAIDENNGLIDGKIADAVSGLNTRIDSEVSTINKRIDAIEMRIANLEAQVSALVSRIQSLTYIPRYTDGASTMWVKIQSDGSTITRDTLEFRVSPADCSDSLVKVWDKAITAEAVTLATRASQETISLPVVSVIGGNGKLSVVLEGNSLGERFFTGEQQMKAVVIISDGNNERTSEYVSMVAKDDPKIPNNIILYTSSDGKIVEPNNTEAFGATIVSNKYENGRGIILFDKDITSIGVSAFYQCTSLTSIQIPNSVTSIGMGAFVLTQLTAIYIPKYVEDIYHGNPFMACQSLASITVDPENPVYDSRNDCNAIVETKSNTIVTGCNNTVIPDSVTKIGHLAFSHSRITTLNIPSSVTSLGTNPFISCVQLASITVDPGNPAYDSRNNCNALIETKSNTLVLGCKNTIIPDSITSIGECAFYSCIDLTTIKIPNSVTSIEHCAFFCCYGLTSIQIPDSVTSIGDQAFAYCTGLTSIQIPNSVTRIESYTFSCCTGLTSIQIPNSVIFIANEAFEYCTGLTSIQIPDSVTSIANDAFSYCSGIASIKVDPSNQVFDSRDNCNAIIDTKTNTLVVGCKNTIIPDSVTTIGDGAFLYCSGLTSIQIPNSVTRIRNSAFSGCAGLSSISFLATNPCYLSDSAFSDTNDCPIYVPAESVESYKLAPGWNRYSDRIQAMPATKTSKL